MTELVPYTRSRYRRFSPYADPLTIREQLTVLHIQQSLHAITLCAACRAARDANITALPNCPRCKLINRPR